MKLRIRYDWDRMCWIAPLQAFQCWHEANIIAESINRRIRLKYVGAHV